jgi:hypothetical protein
MYNFYEYFEITENVNFQEIIEAYKIKIKKYLKYSDLTSRQKYEIKMLKIGLYILTNNKLRNKYNKLIKIKNNGENKISNENELNTKPISIPNEHNIIYDYNLDNLFKIDNSWMESVDKKKDEAKKNRIEPNSIGDRIFSLAQPTKNYPTDFEYEIRKKTQCRNID